jgi:hypothetical protein
MFHDANPRMRTWKYVRSASNPSAPSTWATLCMGLLTEKDGTDDKKGVMHRVVDVADLTFVKEQTSMWPRARDEGNQRKLDGQHLQSVHQRRRTPTREWAVNKYRSSIAGHMEGCTGRTIKGVLLAWQVG